MKATAASAKAALVAALSLAASAVAFAGNGQWTLIGWNNLGMHCMDDDYSVFTILPPYNTVDSQLIDATGKLVISPTGLTVTYEPVADLDGSINSTSAGKTNFWDFVHASYGAALPINAGLAGNAMPGAGKTPQPLTWNGSLNWFEGLGIPLAPIDDAGRPNTYPMMRLVAKNNAGTVLAKTDVVLPVSGEMDCRACHASGAGDAAKPAAGWVYDPHPSRDYRLNILRLHDEKQIGNPDFTNAVAGLAQHGYLPAGLVATVTAGATPILCASCHASEALGTKSAPNTKSLTAAMHGLHAGVINPANGMVMDNIANRSACYQCHPGSTTRCLRGAMGSAVAQDGSLAMQCQSCHGTMSQVGSTLRTGWLDEPQCANCHTGSATQNNGQIRYTSAFDLTGNLRVPVSTLFSTNPDTPLPGKSLYRFSKGHGGLQCEACHGSTHAEFPAAGRNDNVQSVQLQGHVGALMECTACHATMPSTVTGGPHGMHPLGASWVSAHHDVANDGRAAQCQVCHGTDYRGTVLSRAAGDRTLSTRYGTKTFYRGYEVSCYSCHNGATNDNNSTHTPPTVTNATLAVPANLSASLTLSATGTTSTVRINRQPSHGTVALTRRLATYFAEPGYVGPDSFAYVASDPGGFVDSTTAGVVAVTVGAFTGSLDSDGDGIPDLVEYALGLSPTFASSNGATNPVIETVGGLKYLTLNIARFLPPSDVTLSIEVSGDLVTWQPATIVTNTPTLLKARDPLPVTSGSGRFIRVRANR